MKHIIGLFLLCLIAFHTDVHAFSGQITVSGCEIIYDVECDASPIQFQPVDETAGAQINESVRIIARLFSSTVCIVETIIAETMGNVWCTVSDAMKAPLAAAMVLYVTVLGILYAIGVAQITLQEAGKQIIKLSLIWVFATQSQYALGIMFQFYMWLIKDGIAIVLNTPDGEQLNSATILYNVDLMFSHIFGTNLESNETETGVRMMTALAGIASLVTMPGGFIIGPALFAQGAMSFMVFARTILTYLVAITAIVFYLTLGPVYLCFALFKSTDRIFNNWLGQIAAYALQPVIIFAYLMMVEAYITNLTEMFGDIFYLDDIINQTQITTENAGATPSLFANFQMPCFRQAGSSECVSADFDFSDGFGDWIELFRGVGAVAILNYATVQFLELVPELARQLAAGGARAIAIGGGKNDRSFAPGGKSMQATGIDGAINSFIDPMAQANQGRNASGRAPLNADGSAPSYDQIFQAGVSGYAQYISNLGPNPNDANSNWFGGEPR